MVDKKLLAEYRSTLTGIRRAKRKYKESGRHIREILSGMEASTGWVIDYLETEREPEPRRGIHRRSKNQREVLLGDMDYMALSRKLCCGFKPGVGPERIAKLEKALAALSERERDVFKLVVGERFTLEQTAELLGISKSSVQVYLRRAKQKAVQQPSVSYKSHQ